MLTICNEPVQPLANLRSPRIWRTIMAPDLPGKIVLAQIQLNHALVDEERPTLDKRLLDLYGRVLGQFAALHGDGTRCFLARAPESLNLIGHHIKDFGGATNGIACYETVFCVSPRTDGRVAVSHVEARFAPVEFELLDGLPKARVLDWARHLKECAGQKQTWAEAIKFALQYHVNRHKGPTGQIELPIAGLNIVVGSILPVGLTTHSQTTLAAAALIAAMGLTGEWGKLPLSEFAGWLKEADAGAHGRRSELGPIVFGMPGETLHVDYNPARAKGRALPHDFAFVTAHSGVKPACSHDGPQAVDILKTPAARATTTAVALALFRQIVKNDGTLWLSDEIVYDLLRQIPERASRAEILKRLGSDDARAELQVRFATHDEPAGGYNLREKLLYTLSEMRRAQRAAEVIRVQAAPGLATLLQVSQAGECNTVNEVTALGHVVATHAVPSCVSDAELEAVALSGEPLWRQTGKSGASSVETDLLCDIALAVNGVLGARYCEPNRVVILCKAEAPGMLLDTLQSAYYSGRGFDAPLAERIYPCQGAGILAI